jgi:hypothetical protein
MPHSPAGLKYVRRVRRERRGLTSAKNAGIVASASLRRFGFSSGTRIALKERA